ncbi:hypothetical protein N9B94_04545 [Verrucomicrobia bacterium]|nr:hypothetical protein [Verrucomicrobiota bacterium]
MKRKLHIGRNLFIWVIVVFLIWVSLWLASIRYTRGPIIEGERLGVRVERMISGLSFGYHSPDLLILKKNETASTSVLIKLLNESEPGTDRELLLYTILGRLKGGSIPPSTLVEILRGRNSPYEISDVMARMISPNGKYLSPLMPFLEANCDTNSGGWLSLMIATAPESIPRDHITELLDEARFDERRNVLSVAYLLGELKLNESHLDSAFMNLGSTNRLFREFNYEVITSCTRLNLDLNGYWKKHAKTINPDAWSAIGGRQPELLIASSKSHFLLNCFDLSDSIQSKLEILGVIEQHVVLEETLLLELWKRFNYEESSVQIKIAAILLQSAPVGYTPLLAGFVETQVTKFLHATDIVMPSRQSSGDSQREISLVTCELAVYSVGFLRTNETQNFELLRKLVSKEGDSPYLNELRSGASIGLLNLAGHYRAGYDKLFDDSASYFNGKIINHFIEPNGLSEFQIMELIRHAEGSPWSSDALVYIMALSKESRKEFVPLVVSLHRSLSPDVFRFLFMEELDGSVFFDLLITRINNFGCRGFEERDLPMFEHLQPRAREISRRLLIDIQGEFPSVSALANEILEVIDSNGSIRKETEAKMLSYEIPSY